MKKLIGSKVMSLVDELHENGATCYVVGGFVRDFLLKRDAYDIDLEVHNIDVKKLEKILVKHTMFELQGNFGIYILKDIKNVEISIPRKESSIGIKHDDFEINLDPFMGSKQASKRRDFTVNALMYNLKTDVIIDEHNGLDDFKKKILRHVSDKFIEDDLRVFRAVRFASQLGFSIDKSTIKLCKTMDVNNISNNRKADEFKKFILGQYVYETLDLFKEILGDKYGLGDLHNVEQNYIYHPEGNAWIHTKEAVRIGVLIFSKYDIDTKFIGLTSLLFHDIGKICKIQNSTMEHEILSITMFERFSEQLINNKSHIKLIQNCIRYHMEPREIKTMDSEFIYLLLITFDDNIELFLNVCAADVCCRYNVYEKYEVLNSVEDNHKKITNRFLDIYSFYKEIMLKYNGLYFINLGFSGSEIKNKQKELAIQLIDEFNREWSIMN
ncbi:MAG: hypothetical protein ACRC5R_05215 [Mycoplasmatales bacterium]